MNKQKISTIATITILTLSMLLAAIPMAHAIDTPTLRDSDTGDSTTGGPCHSFVDVVGGGATGFGKVEVYWDTLATKLGEGYADSDGDYEIKMIQIPEAVNGTYSIIVYDVLSSDINYTTYDVTPSITLSTTKALPGDSVTVTGSGFGEELDVQIYLNATAVTDESVPLSGYSDGTVPIENVTGTLENTPIAPFLTKITLTVNGTTLDVLDTADGVLFGEGIFNLGGSDYEVNATGTIDYDSGFFNLTVNANETINLAIDSTALADYTHYLYDVTSDVGTTTSELGSFMATFIVPGIDEDDYGEYTVTAVDTDGNTAENLVSPPLFPPFTVDYYVTLDPAAGPTGITTTISGRIESDTDYEIRFGAASIASGTSGADGSFTATYVIPDVLPEADYTVSVVWNVTEHRDATFRVTPPPALTKIQPPSGQPGDVITISGENFTAGADISLYLGATLVNSTDMDDRFGPTGAPYTPTAGKFTDLEFTVPNITPGVYVLKVVDENGASTGTAYTFTVTAPPETTVTLNGATYYPGDTLSFTIETTEDSITDLTVTIYDPSGKAQWTISGWNPTGTLTKFVPIMSQVDTNNNPITLPADAPLGTWNWTVTYKPASTNEVTKATGLFSVVPMPTMQTVVDQLNDNTTTVLDSIDDLQTAITTLVNNAKGDILDAIGDLNPKLKGLEDLGVVIATDVGEVKVALENLDLDALGLKIDGIQGDVAYIKSNIGDITTSVDNLGAKITALSGDVATVSTKLGTLEGTVTSIDGKTATVKTDVGDIKADVSDILAKPVDITPVWIAVVLSLIAAIAAVFAVVTIRQKIAG